MTWDNVLKIVTAALASVGGISAVIILAVKWSSGIFISIIFMKNIGKQHIKQNQFGMKWV